MSVLSRNNVHIRGLGERAMIFVHGYGCDQTAWRHVAPCFERDFVTVLIDQVGAGRSQLSAYVPSKYGSLTGYADDLLEIGRELDLDQAILVGHCYGGIVAGLACAEDPQMFSQLIIVASSARYLGDPEGYRGGFSAAQVSEMLAQQRSDYPAWCSRMAPLFMGHTDRPELTDELIRSFGRLDAEVANDALAATLRCDFRDELAQVAVPTLLLQCREDCFVPDSAAREMHRRLPLGRLVLLSAHGHFPHLSAPAETVSAINAFLREHGRPPRKSRWQLGGRSVEDLIQTGTSILAIPQARNEDAQERAQREELLNDLLARMGELCLHLGRYDQYALTLQDLIGASDETPESDLTMMTRGAFITHVLDERHPQVSNEFGLINAELLAVIHRNSMTARQGAAIPGLFVQQKHWSRLRDGRDWFDKFRATTQDIEAQLEQVERDILRVVSLCFKICRCALLVQRLKH